jgi:hypothetical protein
MWVFAPSTLKFTYDVYTTSSATKDQSKLPVVGTYEHLFSLLRGVLYLE